MWVLIPVMLGVGMLLLNPLPPLVGTADLSLARGMFIHHRSLMTTLRNDASLQESALPVNSIFRQSGLWKSAVVATHGDTLLLTWPTGMSGVSRSGTARIMMSLGKAIRQQGDHPHRHLMGVIDKSSPTDVRFAGMSVTDIPREIMHGTPALGSILQ